MRGGRPYLTRESSAARTVRPGEKHVVHEHDGGRIEVERQAGGLHGGQPRTQAQVVAVHGHVERPFGRADAAQGFDLVGQPSGDFDAPRVDAHEREFRQVVGGIAFHDFRGHPRNPPHRSPSSDFEDGRSSTTRPCARCAGWVEVAADINRC